MARIPGSPDDARFGAVRDGGGGDSGGGNTEGNSNDTASTAAGQSHDTNGARGPGDTPGHGGGGWSNNSSGTLGGGFGPSAGGVTSGYTETPDGTISGWQAQDTIGFNVSDPTLGQTRDGVSIGRTATNALSQADLDARSGYTFGSFSPGFSETAAPPGTIGLQAPTVNEQAGWLNTPFATPIPGVMAGWVVSPEGLLSNTHVADPAIGFSPTQAAVDVVSMATGFPVSTAYSVAQRTGMLPGPQDVSVAAVGRGWGEGIGTTSATANGTRDGSDQGSSGGSGGTDAGPATGAEVGADTGKNTGKSVVAALPPYVRIVNPYTDDYASYGQRPAHQWFSNIPLG